MSRAGLPPRAPSGGAPPEVAVLPDGQRVELAGPAREIAHRHRTEYPDEAQLRGAPFDLIAPAREICRRYRVEFPDEDGRYGDAGMAWCVHDNRHILNWAAMDVEYGLGIERQLEWLADVLRNRDFPIERLVRDLEIAAEVVEDAAVAERLRAGAEFVRGL